DQVVHVALGLCELHFIHALTRVPVQESLAPEHGGELLRDPLEELLDGRAVADKGGGHLEAAWRDVADGRLLLHGHAAREDGSHRQVAAVAGVAGGHHVLGVEHLLRQLGHRQGAVLLAAAAGQRGKARHEEVQPRERHHVDRQLAQVGVQLAGEAEAGGHATHGGRHQVVEVP
ncbi:hypothetical protein N307_04810, partial [Dryobates pubescens]